ncbi:MAG: hypothetical protein EOP42_17745 [Sphingobacteriaceae bacterium]|nr:MAG: hypothetical protein EOP42_17745 [Sphingobacteriaceae bacterium]
MEAIDHLRNNIINQLLTISDPEYLSAIYKIVKQSTVQKEVVQLSEEQVVMLQSSETDIENGDLITQSELNKNDLEWLNGQ